MQNYYGGFRRRGVAILIDGILMLLVDAAIKLAMGVKVVSTTPEVNSAGVYAFLINLAVGFSYFTFIQAKYNGTIGKHLLGLTVLDAETLRPISIGQAVGRYLMQTVSGIVFCLGYITAIRNPKKQSWHDRAAKTVVVKKACLNTLREEEGILPETRFKKSQLKSVA